MNSLSNLGITARGCVVLLACAVQLACNDKAPAAADSASTASAASSAAPVDSAVLSAESARIAGFTSDAITRAPWHNVWSAAGRIALDASATEVLGSIVEGRVVKVYVAPGDQVRRGQVLVAIHSHEIMDARAALGRARATMSHAESELRIVTSAAARAERLYEIKALSLADLERARGTKIDAQAQLDAAKFEQERADSFLDHLVGDGPLPAGYDEHWVLIRAPLDGQVVNRSVQPGNVVLVGATLLSVSQTSSLTLIAQLPEAASAVVATGTKLTFTVDVFGDHRFNARVLRVLPGLDSVTRTIALQAAIIPDRRFPLRAEMFALAEIEAPAAEPVLSVPVAAVQTLDDNTVIIQSVQRGTDLHLQAVPVRVGRRTRERVELVSGADTSRRVIVDGAAIAKAELLKRRGGG